MISSILITAKSRISRHFPQLSQILFSSRSQISHSRQPMQSRSYRTHFFVSCFIDVHLKFCRSVKKDFIILSGDNEEIVKEVANKVGINLFHGNLLPLDKVKYIKKYQQKGKVMFVGDGINDAPVLKISDIGISMGNIGTDAAIEASDIVLMNDNLLTIATAIKIAKKTKRKVVESIILALSVKFIVLVLGLFGMSTIYMAVFADVGVTFLVILNVLTIFYKKL